MKEIGKISTTVRSMIKMAVGLMTLVSKIRKMKLRITKTMMTRWAMTILMTKKTKFRNLPRRDPSPW